MVVLCCYTFAFCFLVTTWEIFVPKLTQSDSKKGHRLCYLRRWKAEGMISARARGQNWQNDTLHTGWAYTPITAHLWCWMSRLRIRNLSVLGGLCALETDRWALQNNYRKCAMQQQKNMQRFKNICIKMKSCFNSHLPWLLKYLHIYCGSVKINGTHYWTTKVYFFQHISTTSICFLL